MLELLPGIAQDGCLGGVGDFVEVTDSIGAENTWFNIGFAVVGASTGAGRVGAAEGLPTVVEVANGSRLARCTGRQSTIHLVFVVAVHSDNQQHGADKKHDKCKDDSSFM